VTTDWTARAKAQFAQEAPERTNKTPKTGVSGVLGVLSGGQTEKSGRANPRIEISHERPERTNKTPETPDPDRSCWPHSDAANTAELAAMEKRLALFERRRVPVAEAEHLADRLLARDRELDDRHLCIECTHGTKARCPGGAPLPGVLQRCPAFTTPEEPA